MTDFFPQLADTPATSPSPGGGAAPVGRMACLGGGHGLYQTLLAARELEVEDICAIVTVADDGGSSGRLRKELDIIPPGDLRMALAALAGRDGECAQWAHTLQHRFGGSGALAGHAVGNLLIAGLTEVLGDMQSALDAVARLTSSAGRVVPVVNQPLDIEAQVRGLDEDPAALRSVRGQVAVATTPGQVESVRILTGNTAEPEPPAHRAAVEALLGAELITLGPGSWFTSVIPHVLVPDIVQAINASQALRVVVLNLTPELGETRGFSAERHIQVLAQHAPQLRVDYIVVDTGSNFSPRERAAIQRAASSLGAQAVFMDVAESSSGQLGASVHDPHKLAAAFAQLYARPA
ncbi:gluconeogenesis factor YvcK family protein [Corynebacterium lizhenjunii]|uniref:gluconeogenesis factor YvcK family protein n=1 Tax=Corynebacterium lizhenjunii TaxID=2709394 RepID=UPI0039A59BFC